MPYDGHGKTPYCEIDEKISKSVPPVELILVDATAVLYGFVPEKCHRSAFEDCNKDAYDKV